MASNVNSGNGEWHPGVEEMPRCLGMEGYNKRFDQLFFGSIHLFFDTEFLVASLRCDSSEYVRRGSGLASV